MFSAALYDTRNLPSGEKAHALMAAVCAFIVYGNKIVKMYTLNDKFMNNRIGE